MVNRNEVDLNMVQSSFEELEEYLRQAKLTNLAPCLSLGLMYRGKTVYSLSRGWSHFEQGKLVTDTTRFRLASVTKVLTALCLCRLAEKSVLSLDTVVQNILPWCQPKEANGRLMTVRDLLSHGAGLPMDAAFPYWTTAVYPQREDLIKTIPFQRQVYAPGTRFKYSNLGFAIVGLLVEQITGEDFSCVLDKEIIHPLGMKHTSLEPDEFAIGETAIGYRRVSEGKPKAPVPFIQEFAMAPCGNAVSTVEDMQLLLTELCSGQRLGLEKSTLYEMMRIHHFINPWTVGYGLGLYLRNHSEGTLVSHGGELAGHKAQFMLIPERQVGVIVLSNNETAPVFSIAEKGLTSCLEHANQEECCRPIPEWNDDWNLYLGDYADTLDKWEIARHGNTLVLLDGEDNVVTNLTPLSRHLFVMDGGDYHGEQLEFIFDSHTLTKVKYGEDFFYPLHK